MSSYEQALAGTSITLTETFQSDLGPTDVDSGTPTLVVTKPDGTAFTPTPTVQTTWTGRTTGQYRWVFNPQADPYVLTYKLTGTIGSIAQALPGTAEWVGDLLFTLAEFRQLRVGGSKPFTDTTTYPNSDIQHVRAEILDEFTQILGFSPVPRFRREIHSVSGWDQVVLKELMVTSLLTVNVNGTSSATSGYYVDPGGALLPVSAYAPSAWTAYGLGNVAVEFVAGMDRVPGRGRAAAMLMAGAALNPAGFSTAQSVSLPTGESYVYEPAETGRGGFERHTGVRELDRWLNRWTQGRRAGVA